MQEAELRTTQRQRLGARCAQARKGGTGGTAHVGRAADLRAKDIRETGPRRTGKLAGVKKSKGRKQVRRASAPAVDFLY